MAMRASVSAAKQIWRAVRNRRVKLGGIGNTVGGRVRRFVLLEVEGMTALTGEGDDAPHAMLSAVEEGTHGSTNVRGGVSRLRHGIGTNVEQDVSSTRGRDDGSGDESDREYDSRRGMGRLGQAAAYRLSGAPWHVPAWDACTH